MTNQEFSNEFDVLYNNIMSNQAPGLDEYEKSVFLTKAQNELVKNYFNPKGNKYQEGYDGSAKRQVDFSQLIKNYRLNADYLVTPFFTSLVPWAEIDTLSPPTKDVVAIAWPTNYPDDDGQNGFIKDSGFKSVFLIINENVLVKDTLNNRNKILQVIPIRFDEYTRLMSKPYHRPNKNQAWRIIVGKETEEKSPTQSKYKPRAFCELHIGNNNEFLEYSIRYLRRPSPIILTDLPDELSIGGVSTLTECELDPEIHPEILQRAVELAKAAYVGDLNSTIELGKRSE